MSKHAGWKQAETSFAKDVQTARIPVTGERYGADFLDGRHAYQLKCRSSIPSWVGVRPLNHIQRRMPLWMERWLAGIIISAQRAGRTGVLVLRQRLKKHAVVVMRHEDWVSIYGPVLPIWAWEVNLGHDRVVCIRWPDWVQVATGPAPLTAAEEMGR